MCILEKQCWVCWVQIFQILTSERHLFLEEQKNQCHKNYECCPSLSLFANLAPNSPVRSESDHLTFLTNRDDDQEQQPSQPRSGLSTILAWSSLPPKKLILSAINLKVANFRHFSPWRTFRPGFNLLAQCVLILHSVFSKNTPSSERLQVYHGSSVMWVKNMKASLYAWMVHQACGFMFKLLKREQKELKGSFTCYVCRCCNAFKEDVRDWSCSNAMPKAATWWGIIF